MVALAAALVGALALIYVQLEVDDQKPDSTTLGLFLVAALLGFALLAPGLMLRGMRRVSRFKVGNIELGLAEIKRAERVRPPQEDDGVRRERKTSTGYDQIVERLRSRLNMTREMLKLESSEDDFVGIAEELRRSELLTRDEETFVVDLQNHDPLSADWSTATEAKFLDDSWAFAVRFRALVWDRYVRRQLKEEGWSIFEYEQKRGHRPDFLAYNDGRWALVAARVGSHLKDKTEKLDIPAKRLAKTWDGPELSSRSVVVPDLTRGCFSKKADRRVHRRVQLLDLQQFLSKV